MKVVAGIQVTNGYAWKCRLHDDDKVTIESNLVTLSIPYRGVLLFVSGAVLSSHLPPLGHRQEQQ